MDLLKLAADIPPAQRHFFIHFEGSSFQVERIPPGRFGTLSEMTALAKWLGARPHIRSVLVVSSGTHLRCVRMCCQALLPPDIELRLIAGPEKPARAGANDVEGKAPATVGILAELAKVCLYWLVLVLARNRPRDA